MPLVRARINYVTRTRMHTRRKARGQQGEKVQRRPWPKGPDAPVLGPSVPCSRTLGRSVMHIVMLLSTIVVSNGQSRSGKGVRTHPPPSLGHGCRWTHWSWWPGEKERFVPLSWTAVTGQGMDGQGLGRSILRGGGGQLQSSSCPSSWQIYPGSVKATM